MCIVVYRIVLQVLRRVSHTVLVYRMVQSMM